MPGAARCLTAGWRTDTARAKVLPSQTERPVRMHVGFTVILPVYNRAAHIAPALASVLDQTRPAEEIIVVDDGSSDDLESALAPYRDRITLIRQENGGVAKARNTGAAAATQPWLTFQDSDDLWAPDHLETVARDLAHADDDVVCHLGDVTYVGEGYREGLFEVKARSFPMDHAERVEDPLPLVISGMTLQAAAIRADVFAQLGGFDVEMRMLSDTAFFCQLALEGPFVVTGRNMADILRLEGDQNAITSMHRTKRLYAREMHVRILDRIPQARLSPGNREMVRRLLSGAQFRMAEVLAETDRVGALRLLVRSARLHPSSHTGWIKAAIGLLGPRGYAFLQRRHKVLDRS